jgi:hypothetical protein
MPRTRFASHRLSRLVPWFVRHLREQLTGRAHVLAERELNMKKTPTGEPARVFYFSYTTAGVAAPQLAAAVVWRELPFGPRGGAGRWTGWPGAWLRLLRHRLWLRLGPFGLDLQWRSRPKHSRAGVNVTALGFPGDVEPRAYYDGRFVRLLGRIYEVPADGHALVLLVEERREQRASGGRLAAPVVAIRTVLIPPIAASGLARAVQPWDDSLGEETSDVRTVTVFGGALPEWDSALQANPEVRAFMMAASDA